MADEKDAKTAPAKAGGVAKGEPAPQPAAAGQADFRGADPKGGGAPLVALWKGLKVGDVVLAEGFDEANAPVGWWPARIERLDAVDVRVRWLDGSDTRLAVRQRPQIGLLHPEALQA
ncbi:MAG: hypothetical protein BGP06_09485 [Rhizobiales bacterium 65-9]|nr:MAG: hypothetical protein BGP06_09485 [Rhizobiales bacterium 65-9]